MEDLIKTFLSSGSGSGSGSGYGSGYGDGSGYGSGYGDGSGSGSGSGVKRINGEDVYRIDGVQTVLSRIHGQIAKGAILQSDLTLLPCYVIKEDGYFAHGETLRQAAEALRDKILETMPEEDRIGLFVRQFRPGVDYQNTEYFEWHHRLTGSCETGRKQFAKDHGIDLLDSMTPEEFIRLTRNAYGGEIIRKLAEHYPKS